MATLFPTAALEICYACVCCLPHTDRVGQQAQSSKSHGLITGGYSMEARDLEYFAVAAELGNLRRAAEVLNLSQPALSKSLRRLERAAGAKLVKRTQSGIELTAVGIALLPHAKRMRLSFEEISRELKESTHGVGILRIGVAPVQMRTLLGPACVQLHRESPKVILRITIAGNDQLLPALAAGNLDVTLCGIPAHPTKDLVQDRIQEDRFSIYSAAHHKLAARRKLGMADLAGQKWALPPAGSLSRKLLQHAIESAGAGPLNIVMETFALMPKLQLVAETDVLGFAPWREVQDLTSNLGLVELPVSGLEITRLVGISYRKDAYSPPSLQRFVEIVKNCARGSSGQSSRK
jgi:DNA-binding transcriptional LysR family regulator